MNITYTWSITGLKRSPSLNGLTNVVTGIKFNYTGVDSESGESYTFPGAVPVGEPSPDNFTLFENLTEADIISWAQANHPTDHMNKRIEEAIARKISPIEEDIPLPWSS